MPQTNDAINTVEAVVEVSTDGTTWTNISGTLNKVTPSPMTAMSGQVHTTEGQYPIVRAGKYNMSEVAVTIVYTETAGEAYAILQGQKNVPGRPLYFRWTPGGYNGNYRFKSANSTGNTAPARIVEFPLPPVDASDATPTTVEFKLQATQFVQENATPSPSASLSPSASSSA